MEQSQPEAMRCIMCVWPALGSLKDRESQKPDPGLYVVRYWLALV